MILQKQDVDIAVANVALSNIKDGIKLVKRGNAHYQKELLEKLEKKKDKDGVTSNIQGTQIRLWEKFKRNNKGN